MKRQVKIFPLAGTFICPDCKKVLSLSNIFGYNIQHCKIYTLWIDEYFKFNQDWQTKIASIPNDKTYLFIHYYAPRKIKTVHIEQHEFAYNKYKRNKKLQRDLKSTLIFSKEKDSYREDIEKTYKRLLILLKVKGVENLLNPEILNV